MQVSGSGVVGRQPVLEKDEEFSYTSACPLSVSMDSLKDLPESRSVINALAKQGMSAEYLFGTFEKTSRIKIVRCYVQVQGLVVCRQKVREISHEAFVVVLHVLRVMFSV